MPLSRALRFSGWMLEHFPDWLVDLGELESRWLGDKVHAVPIQQPVYIGSLARSGSTILLESIAQHPSMASFCYRDFPFVQVPVWWRRLSGRIFDLDAAPAERAHADRILVTPDSPEAFEEILWMHFFPQIHREHVSHLLESDRCHPDFEKCYRGVIQKLLWQQGVSRYVAKGNYNISRMDYLSRLFPDAKFVLPVRHPLAQVASLLRQHRHFCHLEQEDPATLKYLQRAGHFEFGLDRRPVNTGNPEDSRQIRHLFDNHRDVEAYALQWRVIYQYVNEVKNRANVKLVRYEDLCADADQVLTDLYQWLGLEATAQQHAHWQKHFSLPEHRTSLLTAQDEQVIAGITGEVARALGY